MLKNETFLSNFHTIWWATGPLMDSPLGHTRLIISIFGKLFQFLMHLWLIPKDQSSYFTNAQWLEILQKRLILNLFSKIPNFNFCTKKSSIESQKKFLGSFFVKMRLFWYNFKHCAKVSSSQFFVLFFIFEDSKVQYKAAYINLVSASDVMASREYTQPWAKWMCQLAKKPK